MTSKTAPFAGVKTAVTAAAKANDAAEKGSREARVLSAKATHLAVSEGAIGKTGLYPRQEDYAKALHVSESSITGLKRLGYFLSIGVVPGSDTWNLLSSKAGTKEVGAMVDLKTAKAVEDAVKKTWTPDGKKNGTKAPGETTRKEAPASEKVPAMRNNSVRLDVMEQALAGLADMTAAEVKRLAELEDRLQTILADAHKSLAAKPKPKAPAKAA